MKGKPWGHKMTDTTSDDFAPNRSWNIPRVLRDWALFDRLVALFLAPLVVLVLAFLAPVVLIAQGRPFFFSSERMATPDKAFRLWKIRTMRVEHKSACSVLGGDMAAAVTPIGRFLRRFRLDELPQIFNVLKGDMRFIGPRPPLRRYVQAYPEIYRQVLQSKPGVTGLATVTLHQREERILSRCRTAAQSDKAYRDHCIGPKARLDLLYQRRQSVGLDLLILFRTFARLTKKRGRHCGLGSVLDVSGQSRPVKVAACNAREPQRV